MVPPTDKHICIFTIHSQFYNGSIFWLLL